MGRDTMFFIKFFSAAAFTLAASFLLADLFVG
jgi:hypothetical protein